MDLIPDFIPILDDLLLVPVGIWLAVKMIPTSLATELRAKAAVMAERPVSRGAAVTVGFIWIALAVAAAAAVPKRSRLNRKGRLACWSTEAAFVSRC